jgi:hypothetical protein
MGFYSGKNHNCLFEIFETESPNKIFVLDLVTKASKDKALNDLKCNFTINFVEWDFFLGNM